MKKGSKILWQFLSLNGHYAYWKEKTKKTKFETNEMVVKKTLNLRVGEYPEYHII